MVDTDSGLVVVALSAFLGDSGQILAAALSDRDLIEHCVDLDRHPWVLASASALEEAA